MSLVRTKYDKLTPTEAMKAYCRICVGSQQEVKNCDDYSCVFHAYREGKRIKVKLIREFCLDCCGGSKIAVEECPSTDCVLYPYRFGTNPNRKGIGNKNLGKK